MNTGLDEPGSMVNHNMKSVVRGSSSAVFMIRFFPKKLLTLCWWFIEKIWFV